MRDSLTFLRNGENEIEIGTSGKGLRPVWAPLHLASQVETVLGYGALLF